MLGYFEATISVCGKSTCGKIYVSCKGDDLLGWSHQKKLGVSLHPSKTPQVQADQIECNKTSLSRSAITCFKRNLASWLVTNTRSD